MSEGNTAKIQLSGSECLRQCERTACRVIDGKAVVITIDRNQLHVLSRVGTRVWELMDGRPLSAIVSVITEEFEVDPGRAALDVHTFAQRLLVVGAARAAAVES
ncbi:MAG: hypothetical protein RL685_3475 [Pseudomonadota bacterium]|jgi:hypothetical protein